MVKVNIQLPSQDLWTLSRAFNTVTSKTGLGVYASSDQLFRGAVFGRDSLEVAEDIIDLKPRIVKKILKTMAQLQGVRSNSINEEEKGKIVHEFRQPTVDGKPLDDMSRTIFEQLTAKWGLDGENLTYYGSIDSTPLFVRVLCRYAQIHGKSILKESVVQRDGLRASLLSCLSSALEWINKSLDSSTTGLLEYLRRNPHGIENQVWKDSTEFYVHENGELANFHAPIASIEVQGLVYDALILGGELLPEQAAELNAAAVKLRDKTIELLWLPERNYFALGADHNPKNGSLRIIETTTANPAALLDSGFFDAMEEPERKKYVSAIVSKMASPEFITDAGIRSRSIDEARVINFWDYHGSFSSWPKETYDIAKGLRRQGFEKLAKQLENRILNVIKKSHSYPEFVYVDEMGRVLTGPPAAHSHGHVMLVESTNRPENIQAWTVSAAMAILVDRHTVPLHLPLSEQQDTSWQQQLESKIMARFPSVAKLRWSREIKARYPTYYYKLSNVSK